MPDLPPRLVTALADRYRIERELGEGGMATVHLARDLKHDRARGRVVYVENWFQELTARMAAQR